MNWLTSFFMDDHIMQVLYNKCFLSSGGITAVTIFAGTTSVGMSGSQ
jgi:hypothetical protein